jgi:serine protease
VVVAAGNDAVDVSLFTPGNCDDVIAVSAVDIQKNLAPYSNHGARIDVAAPGGDTRTDLNGDGYPDGVLSTLGDDTTAPVQFEYGFYAGTSMAAPHVAGVVALMKSVNPALTPAQIDQMFIDGELTDDIGDPNSFGNGLINARKAVFAALNAAGTPPVDNPTLAVNPTSLNFGATSNIGSFTLSNTSGGVLQANAPSFSAGWLTVTPASVTDDNLGTYTVTVNRSGLADGWYGDTISISSDANTVEVTALMEVRSVQILPNAGYVYALLLDSETFVTLAVDVVSASGGNYLYAFTDVPDGFYYLVAGSDNDNDFFICDPGESCGTYPTTSLLEIIILDRDLSGRDFPIGYNVLVSGASTESEVDVSPSYRRMTKALKKLRIRQ